MNADALLEKLDARIASLLSDNNPDQLSYVIADRSAVNIPIQLTISTTVSVEVSTNVSSGISMPKDALDLGDKAAADDHLIRLGSAQIFAQGLDASFASQVAADLKRALKLQGQHLADVSSRARYHWTCQSCAGHGATTCANCQVGFGLGNYNGRVPCPQCDGTGKATCARCHGTLAEYVQHRDGSYGHIACRVCHGSGRDGICRYFSCYAGRVPCPICKGTQSIRCTSCDGSGRFTAVAGARLIGHISWGYTLESDAPHCLKDQMKKNDADWISLNVELESASNEKRESGYRINCSGEFPYAAIHFSVAEKPYFVDAIGLQGGINTFPPFLDSTLSNFVRELVQLRNRPDEILPTTQRSRLAQSMFQLVAQGSKKAVETIVTTSGGSISLSLAKEMADALKRAIESIGRQRLWRDLAAGSAISLLLTLVLLAVNSLDWLTRMTALSGARAIFVITLAPLTILGLTYLLARRRWQYLTRSIIGFVPEIAPRLSQALLVSGAMTLAVGALGQTSLYSLSGQQVARMSPHQRIEHVVKDVASNPDWMRPITIYRFFVEVIDGP